MVEKLRTISFSVSPWDQAGTKVGPNQLGPQYGSDQLGLTRIDSDHEKKTKQNKTKHKLNETETCTLLKIKIAVKMDQIKKDL